MMLRDLIRTKQDTNSVWGDLARDERVDTNSWLARGLSRFVFAISAIAIAAALVISTVFIFGLVNGQPNVQEVVSKAVASTYEVECEGYGGTGVAITMPLPDNFKTGVWTAAHVVSECAIGSKIRLVNNGAVYEGILAGKDPLVDPEEITGLEADLAVIYVKTKLPSLDPAPEARLGDWSIVIGNPWDEVNYVTFGVISSVTDKEYKTDAAVNQGNSGGPLLDAHGRVLGLVSYKPYDQGLISENPSEIYDYPEGMAAIKRLKVSCSRIFASNSYCPFDH